MNLRSERIAFDPTDTTDTSPIWRRRSRSSTQDAAEGRHGLYRVEGRRQVQEDQCGKIAGSSVESVVTSHLPELLHHRRRNDNCYWKDLLPFRSYKLRIVRIDRDFFQFFSVSVPNFKFVHFTLLL